MPAFGAVAALGLKKKRLAELSLLFATASLGFMEMLFVAWFELNLFEGYLLGG